jgi:cyclohexanone monooxygenase
MVFMIESQVAYVADALRHLEREGVAAVQPRAEVQAAFVEDLQERMTQTVWSAGGCASWYLDSHGRNVTLWPRATFTFRRLLSSFDHSSYEVVTPTSSPSEPQAQEVYA